MCIDCRLAWNKQDTNYLATVAMDACEVIILDIRVPCTPVARLNNHRACVNGKLELIDYWCFQPNFALDEEKSSTSYCDSFHEISLTPLFSFCNTTIGA